MTHQRFSGASSNPENRSVSYLPAANLSGEDPGKTQSQKNRGIQEKDCSSINFPVKNFAEEWRLLKSDLALAVTQVFRHPAAWDYLATHVLPPLIDAMSEVAPLRIWGAACAKTLMLDTSSCCLVVDKDGYLVHSFGATSLVFPTPNGRGPGEVIKMVTLPLQRPLSTALRDARLRKHDISYGAIKLNTKAGLKVSLKAQFYSGNHQVEGFFVVLIRPVALPMVSSVELLATEVEQGGQRRISELEAELQRFRRSLQATVAELAITNEVQQTTNEELMAANEKLKTANEELKTANEKLQTANEELQSVNEELCTVDVNYQIKIQELVQLNNDIDNLLKSTDVGVIFLDQNLRVRKFTEAVTSVFSLAERDIGRPITDLAHNLTPDSLPFPLSELLTGDRPYEKEIRVLEGNKHLLMRVNPYRVENKIADGWVLTFMDITGAKQAQRALEESHALLRTVLDATPDRIYVKDLEGRYQLVNQPVLQLFNLPENQVIGAKLTDLKLSHLFSDAMAQHFLEEDKKALTAGRALTQEESVQTVDGKTNHYLTTRTAFADGRGTSLGILKFVRDITQQKRAQADLEQANQTLQREIARGQTMLKALQDSEVRFRSTFEQAAVGIAHVAPNGQFLRLNQRFADIVGYPKGELERLTFQDITHSDDLDDDLSYVEQMLAGTRSTYSLVKRYICKDQTIVWVELTVALQRAENGEAQYFISVIQDITSQKQLEFERDRILKELSHEKELAQVTLHSIGDAVITTDAQAHVQYCNPAAEKLTGWSTEKARETPIQDVVILLGADTHKPVSHPVESILTEPRDSITVDNLILVSRNGREFIVSQSASCIRDRLGHLLGVVTVFRDVTEAHTLSQQLSWQASHDPLTGLINRRQFEKELIHALASTRVDDRQEHVLCYLDLDQFKVVNDASGHLAGDELLRQVALLLQRRVRSSDHLARLGGDEFGILLQNCPLSRAEIIANHLREAVQAFRFVWEHRTFSIGVSIGLVGINSTMSDLPGAMSAADAACYAAKEQGRNRVYVYQLDDVDVTRQRNEREWSVRIRNVLERNQFCLYCQAIVPTQQLRHQRATHYEILLRMIGEDGQLIPPNAFIPAAERYDLMPQIDRWVVQRFLSYLSTQRQADPSAIYAVNLSGASLNDESFLAFLKQQIQKNGTIAQQLCFEITETAAIANLTKAVDFITTIRRLGCKFALDDFGSGMSSFGYLKTLPVDYIKIDGKFVQDISTDPAAQAILQSINHIGHVMGLQTIAECVENEATHGCLKQMGVDYVQGFKIGHPRPLEYCAQPG